MIVLYYCIALQIMCLYERVMNKVMCVFINTARSRVRQQADNAVVLTYCKQFVGILSIPLQVLFLLLKFVGGNVIFSVWAVLFVGLLVGVSESSSSVVSLYVNTYNGGIGASIDLFIVKPLQLFDLLFRSLVPLYNAVVWMLSQIFIAVVVPFFGVHVDRLPALVGDFSLMTVLTSRAFGILLARYLECGDMSTLRTAFADSFSNVTNPETFRPFTERRTQHNMQCIANTNYMTLDLMTPGIYARKTALHVHYLATSSCTVMTGPFDIVLYPFLDYNLYKSMHCFANMALHLVIALPILTHARCNYGLDSINGFSEIEKAVMCAPDWQPVFMMTAAGLRALGQLADNWLNIILLVVEHHVGRSTLACAQTHTVGDVWDGVGDMFETRLLHLKVVGVSDAMFAVTDGVSAAYHSMTDGASTVWAIGVFPFQVNTMLGVAAVKYGEVYDPDKTGDTRTGLFGCRCVDAADDAGVSSIQIRCSSVPYQSNVHDNDADYLLHTEHKMVFDSASATATMTCSRTVVKVSSLRFSRKRFSSARASGADSILADPFGAFAGGAASGHSYTADAMVYIQPLCDGPRESCLPDIGNCFPWCMGMHVAGQRNQQIRLYNARTWEDFVTLTQLDCVVAEDPDGACAAGAGARVVDLDASSVFQSACGVTVSLCNNQDSASTIMPTDNLAAGEGSAMLYKRETHAMMRLSNQPFVTAGDVFLHQREIPDAPGEYELLVSRLYDNNQGAHSMQYEQLSLMSNRQTIRLKLCDTEADAFCYLNALTENTIILPHAYVTSAYTNVAVSSEWAVHWAVNPENAIYASVLDFCASRRVGMTITVASSYSKPRVWTLKTVRASSVNPSRRDAPPRSDEHGLFSYMVVPDWVSFEVPVFDESMCDRKANFKIVDLEYINARNVLVTTLHTTMRNYRLDGTVCEGCDYEYKRYFLHPNRHDCVAPDEGEGSLFSCWRHERLGMFEEMELPPEVYGVFCPALRRMPYLGSLFAETALISVHSLQLVLDTATVLIAAAARDAPVTDLFELRMNNPTFHLMLDSGGSALFDFEEIIRSFDKAAFYMSDIIVKSGKIFSGSPAYAYIEPVFAGTAKIVQHTVGYVPLKGPLARQFRAIQDAASRQTAKVSEVTYARAKGKAFGFLTSAQQFLSTQASSLKVSLKLLKKITIKQVVAAAKKQKKRLAERAAAQAKQLKELAMSVPERLLAQRARARLAAQAASRNVKTVASRIGLRMSLLASLVELKDALVTTVAESTEEIERSYLDNLRVMCDGAAQILGTDNAVARSTLHACLLLPDGLQAMQKLMVVLFVDYQVMECVCSAPEEMVRAEVIDSHCVGHMMPGYWRAWVLEQRRSQADVLTSVCFASMDVANDRLLTAFDTVSARLVKLTEALQGLLNYAVVLVGIDTGDCNDYASPYMVSIIAEPADYFMPCIHTPDCRFKCLDEYTAFQAALGATAVAPEFLSNFEIEVESKYFSVDDIENNRHLPPFEIIGITELFPDECRVVCSSGFVTGNRCVAAVGVQAGNSKLGQAYYCIPADMTTYVYQYRGPEGVLLQATTWGADEVVREGYMLSVHKLTDGSYDDVLVTTEHRESAVKSVYMFTAQADRITLLQTEVFDFDKYNFVTDSGSAGYVLNSLDHVRVIPATASRPTCDVFLTGNKVTIEYVYLDGGTYMPEQTMRKVCLRKTISTDQSEVDGFARPLRVVTSDCTARLADIFREGHHTVCLNAECSKVMNVPTSVRSEQQTGTFISYADFDRDSLEQTETSRFLPESVGSSSLAQLIRYDASSPLYVTADNVGVVNKKHVSAMAPVQSVGVRGAPDGSTTVEVMVSGTVSSHRSWLQSLRFRMDNNTARYGARVLTSTATLQTMDLQIECSIDNCVGCQSSPWQLSYVDLQSKCFAAARCGIQKCVGTAVDMRKPFCNFGSLLIEPLELFRIGLHASWKFFAKGIISVVEMSKKRRDDALWEFPDDDLMQGHCLLKDTVIETVSIFTSTLGSMVRIVAMIDHEFTEDRMRSDIMDGRWYARYFMSTTAMTGFISSFFLGPIYGLIAVQKVLSCTANDMVAVVRNIEDGQAPDRFTVTSRSRAKQQQEQVSSICLSQGMAQRMRELGLDSMDSTNSAMANEYVSIVNQLEQIGTSFMLGTLMVPVDVLFAFYIGIVSTFMDWLQTIDWKHCSLPSRSNSRVFECVCGDAPHRVSAVRRAEAVSDAAFWCTGPLLMMDSTGEERLIWNPYSLQELTSAVDAHSAFIDCITISVSCDHLRPRLPALEQQSTNMMPVITKCRENYKNKRWDAGVLALGLFSVDEWREAPASLQFDAIDPGAPGYLQVYKSRLRTVSSLVTGFVLDPRLWRCLNEAVVTGNAGLQQTCLRNWVGVPVDEYFSYEHSGLASFATIDGCRSFSGQIKSFNVNNNAARSLMMWTGSSLNRVPVSERHFVAQRASDYRVAEARARLDELWEGRIGPALRTIALNVSESLRTNLWSIEGDELHQFLDCLIMGPYASADLHASFDMSGGGGKFEVPRYHRGQASSREFGRIELGQTQGSEARRRIVASVLEHVHSRTDSITRTAAVNRINLIRSMFADRRNFECLCPHGPASLLCCARADWTQIADIQFETKNMFANIYNLQSDVVDEAMSMVLQSGIVERIWTGSEFTFDSERPMSERERLELSHAYVFDTQRPVREYSAAETPASMSGSTLWSTCTSLVSASFFTLPMSNGGVDADVVYNPALVDSEQFLHGMEEVIQRILRRARRDSPVFWTRSHRYVASDSVWCEDAAEPVPRSMPGTAFTAQQWRGHAFADEHVRATTLADTVFVGALSGSCLCGWERAGACHIPIACASLAAPAGLAARWLELCTRGSYTTRGELFDLMHLLQTAEYAQSELATCRDLVPDVVWGLLSPARQRAWYAQSGAAPSVDLKHLATYGPSGLRLGLLGRQGEPNSLAAYIREHKLLQRHPAHPPINRKLRHTVAQPVCRPGLQAFLKDDLTVYFRDVLFPMAHSVSEAPAAAYCSTWAIERTIELAMRQIFAERTPDELLQQTQTVGLWRKRCDTQLKQIGICVLRGVFDLAPPENKAVPSTCAFAVGADHGCGDSFYVTSQCVVYCEREFYDPCLCTQQNCADTVFTRATCAAGRLAFNPRSAVTDEKMRLYSMNWPHTVPAAEISAVRSQELDALLGRIRLVLPLVTFDDGTVMKSMAALIKASEPASEAGAPRAHCDDLLDYFDETAQHPVGYHPTCACTRAETKMRGFASWMSEPPASSHAWAVDPVRMRNMTQYSTSYGAAHLVCDAAVYGAYEHQLNGLDLASRWDANAPADPAVPRAAPESYAADMQTEGEPSGEQFDTPLLPGEPDGVDVFLHSTGLVRDWLSAHGPDAALEAALDAAWPLWDGGESGEYGSSEDAVVDNCVQPPLLTCLVGSSECCDGLSAPATCSLACRSSAEDQTQGICVHRDTCFQHRHCRAHNQLCAGNGTCVAAHIYIQNSLGAAVDAQLFSADTATCELPGSGYSSYEGVPDFGRAHGMCSFREWHHYQNITRDTLPGADGLLAVRDRLMHRTDEHVPRSLREARTLEVKPHACDRSYQHTEMRICQDTAALKIRASYSRLAFSPQTAPAEHATAIHTWEDGNSAGVIRFCDMGRERSRTNAVNGFLDPYAYENDVTKVRKDTLAFVPETVGRCQEFAVCPAVIFLVQGLAVHERLVSIVQRREQRTSALSLFRAYSHDDAEACFAAGLLVSADDEAVLCVVDRMSVPLMNFLFTARTSATLLPFSTTFVSGEVLTERWSRESLQRVFGDIRTECPRAFAHVVDGRSGFELYAHTLLVLSDTYEPAKAAAVAAYANLLLPAVFGIDTGAGSDASRGFDTMQEYLALAKCARFVDTRLQHVVEAEFRSARAYTTESVVQEQLAGDSLYLFHARAAVFMPFRWFWQCVVLSKSPDSAEGGAPRNWFSVMTDENSADTGMSCDNYEHQQSLPMTMKKRLQTSGHIYTITDDIPDMASQVAQDIMDTVGIALAQLGLPMFPDVYYMRKRPTDDCMSTNMFIAESCFEKFGRDASDIADPEELILDADGSTITSLYARMRVLLGFVDGDLHDKTLVDLEALGLVSLQISLSRVVPADSNFFPAIRFLVLDRHAAVPTYRAIDPAQVPPDYAVCNVPCTVYTLQQYEYMVQDGRTVDIDVYAGLARRRSVVTQAEAEYLLVQSFRRLIYSQSSFTSNNVHVHSKISRGFMSKRNVRRVESVRAREYNSFMRTKTFRCAASLAYHLASNDLHTRLRTCLERLQDKVGWHVPARAVLHTAVPASVLLEGFLVSFAEHDSAHVKFLQNLTSALWADEDHVSSFDVMCYRLRGETHTINPYWAVNYDVTSGCDTYLQDSLRLVDGRCRTQSASEQCADRFPAYEHAVTELMPAFCRASADTVATSRRGTLRPGITELCDRVWEDPEACHLRHGSFAGAQGTRISATDEVNAVAAQAGLWAYSNSIFRGSVLRPAGGLVQALQLLPTDIAGNSLEFDIDSNGQLVLKCVNLLGEEAAHSCMVSNQHWMRNIEEHWRSQHARQHAVWPRTQMQPAPVSWKCPLQWLQSYSGNTDYSYTMRSPSRDRNLYRFKHITGGHGYAHPVASSTKVPMLMSGRFVSDTQSCTAAAALRPQFCHSAALLAKSIAHARESIWRTVTFPSQHAGEGVACNHILDWPHQTFHTWDEQTFSAKPPDSLFCNVFDRLPAFQMRLVPRARPRAHSGRTSVDRGGVCHMSRLRQGPPPGAAHEHLQYCLEGLASGPASFHCRYLDSASAAAPKSFRRAEPPPAARTPPAPQAFRKNRHCASCEEHRHGAYVDTDGSTTPLSPGRPLLSTGEQVHVSATRMLAAYIRRLVCPEAATAPCPELLRVFNTAHWNSGAFLEAVMHASNTSTFYNSYYHVEQPPDLPGAVDDAALWNRNWVWCEPGAAECRGSVSKADWINPTTRPASCRAAVTQAAQNSLSRVHFCMIDSNTARLCQLVVEWNVEITSILCRAAGLASCAETGFFYNPTSYSSDNREFEHDTVRSFYKSTSTTVCEGPSDELLTQAQIASNEKLLSKCASVGFVPLLALLRAARTVVNLIVELMYYGMQIAFNVVHMIVMGLLPSPGSVSAIANKIVLFFKLALDTLKDIVVHVYKVIFRILFGEGMTKVLVEILKFVCNMVQWVLEVPIKKGFCPVIRVMVSFFQWLHNIFEDIWSVSIAGFRPFRFLEVTVGTYLKTQMKVYDIITSIVCDMDRLQCDFLDYEDEPRNGPGTLPIVTRCWSTYVTFYGDGQSLACTNADTCRKSLTDATLVMCGTCPEQDPPNPLTHHFGCDSITKSCTCATPRLTDSLCYSHSECERPGQSCGFLNSALEPAGAMTLCEACTTRPICYVPRGESVGQCSCGLFEIPFAACRAQDLGQLIAVPFSKMCILQPDARFRFSTSYTAEFSQALATPCMAVDASTAFCTRMADLGGTYIVSTHTTRGRRLLEAVGSQDAMGLGPNTTHSPVCKDALGSPQDSHVRRMCVDLYVRSASTVLHLELDASVPPCAFCSQQDFWNLLQIDPMVLPFLLVHPHKLLHVLFEHTALAHLRHLYRTVQQAAHVVAFVLSHVNVTDYVGVNVTASGLVVHSRDARRVSPLMVMLLQGLANWQAPAASSAPRNASSAAPPGARALLSVTELARDMQREIERAFRTQRTYSTQISSAYSYNFPHAVSQDTRQWLESWPPTLGSSAGAVDGTCTPAYDVALILYYAAGNATLFYASQSGMPTTTLQDSFPRLQSRARAAAALPANPESKLRNDPLIAGIMWMLTETAGALGLQGSFLYDTLYSVFFELQQNIKCDLEALQTCSNWRVKMSNGIFVIGFYFVGWYLVLKAFRLEMLMFVSVPFFGIMLLRLCYGYSWTCFPALPACLLEDIYTSIGFFFPKVILIPQTLWLNAACADQALVESACLKTCQDSPFFYTSAQSVVAWFVAELGGSATESMIDLLEWQTVMDSMMLSESINVNNKVLEDNDLGLVSGHRICAGINSYRLVPYLLLSLVTIALGLFAIRTATHQVYVSLAVSMECFTASFA